MTKLFRKKFKKMYKGVMFGLACLMCVSYMPVGAIASLADVITENDLHVITIETTPKNVINKGGVYNIAVAKYKADGKEYVIVDSTKDWDSVDFGAGVDTTLDDTLFKSSSVTVTYKNTTDTEAVTPAYDGKGVYGTFTPSRVGTYVISYSVTEVSGSVYTYDYEVICETSDAYFKFSALDEGLIPTVYDLGILKEKEEYTDIQLPIPTVYDEDDKLVIDNVQDFYLNATDAQNDNKQNYVILTISGGNTAGVEILQNESNNGFYVDGDTLKDVSGVGNYTVTYSYYQNRQFVTSTDKSFEVANKHYTDKDDKAGYTLNASWDKTPFTTAVTGVKKELPGVKGVTSATDKPASATIPVSYKINVLHKINGQYVDVTEAAEGRKACLEFDDEDDKYYFIPYADGDYKISYTVTDFYGNVAKTETTSFFVTGVKDQQLPTVYAYDANGGLVDGVYTSAKDKLSSTTRSKNIVIYAIGATDNAAKLEDIKLTRIIRDAGSTVRIETSEYTTYNLIFNFSSFQDFQKNNFAVRRDMLNDNVDVNDDAAVRAWLLGHNYLIVTQSYEDSPVMNSEGFAEKFNYSEGTITDNKNEAFNLQTIKDQLVKQGFAYIDYDYNFTSQTYRIAYEARDGYAVEKGDKAQVIYDMAVKTDPAYEDDSAPTITGPKDLQNAYLPTDKITFAEPSASDSEDNYMQIVKAYRYLGSDRKTVIAAGDTTLDFDPANSKWAQSSSSTGWKVLSLGDKETKYTIDLNEIAEKEILGVHYVELLIYAIDDHGNVGTWNKVMTVVQNNDEDPPVLYKVTGYNNKAVYRQGDTITLPKLYFTDDYVDYMSAQVLVYHLEDVEDESGNVISVNRKLMSSSNMSPYADSYTGKFVVDAGSFVASYADKYQVAVIAKDSANHSVATFFEYNVEGVTVVTDPVIDNITSETISLEVGEQRYLPSPTIAISNSAEFKYIGLDTTDSAKTASYYTVNAVTAESSNFTLDKYYFRALSKGKYTIQYKVYLIQYEQKLIDNGTLELNSKGQLKTKDGYFIYVDMENVDAKGNATLGVNTDILGTGTSGTIPAGVKLYTLESSIQTINVKDTGKPVINVDLSEIRASYPTLNTEIHLPKIAATDVSAEGINAAKSYVTITSSRASGTTTIVTVYMDKWADSTYYNATTGNLDFTLSANGTYTIKYFVVDHSNNSSELTKTIANGDTTKPTIEIKDDFLNKKVDEYALGDTLTLNTSKLILEDIGGTSEKNLWKSIEIKLENTDTKTMIKNNGEVNPSEDIYSYSFDLKTAGNYALTITVQDEAGWTTTQTINITVASSNSNPVATYQIVGTVLIVVAVVILTGVIGYFIYSAVKSKKKVR